MQTWVTLAAKHATLASGIGLGTIPAMGWDSLDGVAVGFLLAGAGFAAINSSRRARTCPLPPAAVAGAGAVKSSRQEAGALTRIRRRVDGVLTGMLSDDVEHLAMQTAGLAPLPHMAEPIAAEPGPAWLPWHGDYVDAVVGPAGSAKYAAVATGSPATGSPTAGSPLIGSPAAGGPAAGGRTARTTATESPSRPVSQEFPAHPERVGEWPYLTAVRGVGYAQDAAARWRTGPDPFAKSELAFWGPRPPELASLAGPGNHRTDGTIRPAGSASETGSASKDGVTFPDPGVSGRTALGRTGDGQTGDGRPGDGRRRTPRHAAPPAGFGTTLGRRLASPRFTSRSAAHAG